MTHPNAKKCETIQPEMPKDACPTCLATSEMRHKLTGLNDGLTIDPNCPDCGRVEYNCADMELANEIANMFENSFRIIVPGEMRIKIASAVSTRNGFNKKSEAFVRAMADHIEAGGKFESVTGISPEKKEGGK